MTVVCPGPVPPTSGTPNATGRQSSVATRGDGTALPKPDFGLQLERIAPEAVADQVLAAIEERREYVLTAPDLVPLARARVQHLLDSL